MIRLQKYLADAGVCSRRKAEEFITEGKITVNNEIIKELGTKIDENSDVVKYKGKIVKAFENKVYIMLNKPTGYVCTAKDERDRPIVLDLIKGVKERIFPIGRLDYNSSGLLLLTNDGELTYKLTHPKHEVDKTYVIKIKGVPEESEIDKLREGVMLEGKKTLPANINIIERSDKWAKIQISIHEGRNRQIRKMFDIINHPVIKLKRISMGKIQIGILREGEWRHLTLEEIAYLMKI
jgi:23S rRNA pseudouridine2605 synthase